MAVQMFDLAAELRRRVVSAGEVAARAGISRVTVARIAAGHPAQARTMRALTEALRQFPPVQPLHVVPQTPADAPVMPEPEPELEPIPPDRDPRLLRAELEATRARWQ